MYFEFPGEKLFPRRSHFRGKAIYWGEAIFGEKPFSKTLLPLPCKDLVKKTLTLIQEKSDLLVKNVPNHFLRRSHSPVPCSLFHKRKSVVPFKDSKNSNLISTFSLLHHVWHCPLLSSNMSFKYFLSFELSVSFSNSSFSTIIRTKLKIPNLVKINFNDFFS